MNPSAEGGAAVTGYSSDNGYLQRLDPRVRIIAILLMIIGILLTPPYRWLAYPLLWTLIGCLAVVSGISIWKLNRMSVLALPFALTAFTLLVTVPGQPLVTVAGLTVTDTGLARFIEVLLKSWLSMQTALLLTLSTPITDLLTALAQLKVPATLIAIIGFMYRYLFILKDEAERLLRARAARSGTAAGTKSEGSLLWRAKITGGMVGSLFLRSYERSERVYAAMLARGYDGRLMTSPTAALNRQMIALGSLPVIVILVIQLMARLAVNR